MERQHQRLDGVLQSQSQDGVFFLSSSQDGVLQSQSQSQDGAFLSSSQDEVLRSSSQDVDRPDVIADAFRNQLDTSFAGTVRPQPAGLEVGDQSKSELGSAAAASPTSNTDAALFELALSGSKWAGECGRTYS